MKIEKKKVENKKRKTVDSGFINPTLVIEGEKFTKPNVVEDNIEVYKPNVDIKTYCFFNNPTLMGTTVGEKNLMLTLKHYVTQH